MNDLLIIKTTAFFTETFGIAPEKIVLSPGRINIIGEHIDYNDGFVLPAAIDKIICFAFARNNSKRSKNNDRCPSIPVLYFIPFRRPFCHVLLPIL